MYGRNLVMGEKIYIFKLTLFKLGCLCRSVWDVAFNETFFLNQALKKYIKVWI